MLAWRYARLAIRPAISLPHPWTKRHSSRNGCKRNGVVVRAWSGFCIIESREQESWGGGGIGGGVCGGRERGEREITGRNDSRL